GKVAFFYRGKEMKQCFGIQRVTIGHRHHLSCHKLPPAWSSFLLMHWGRKRLAAAERIRYHFVPYRRDSKLELYDGTLIVFRRSGVVARDQTCRPVATEIIPAPLN